jgi:hypothetical protein
MATKKKTPAQRASERKKKRKVQKGVRYERAGERKAKRASSVKKKTSTGYGKSQRKSDEAQAFKSEGQKIQKSKGQGAVKSRAKLQVTPKSVAVKKYKSDPAFRHSSGGRAIKPTVERREKLAQARKKRKAKKK